MFVNNIYIPLKDRKVGNSNELRISFDEDIFPKYKEKLKPNNNNIKNAKIYGGIPGAGKSGLIKRTIKDKDSFIKIDSDQLRIELPDEKLINYIYKEKASQISQPDVGLAGTYLRNECIKNNFSYILDASLRVPQNAKIEIQKASEKNYNIEVQMLAVSQHEAIQGVFQRYLSQLKSGKNARFVEPSFVKESYKTIQMTADFVNNSKDISLFQIQNRAGKIIYDKSDKLNINPKDILKNQNQDFINNTSPNEKQSFISDWETIIKELEENNTPLKIINQAKEELVEITKSFAIAIDADIEKEV